MACVQVSINFVVSLVSLLLCSCFSVDHNLRAALHKDVSHHNGFTEGFSLFISCFSNDSQLTI